MFCRNCGEPMNENQAICIRCGVKAGTGTTFCANCGNTVNPGAAVCMKCGFAIGRSSNLNGQDKIVVMIVCLFLGGLGIHNFMMGEVKKGIFKIIMAICCGLSSILALIDFIRIAMDTYVVDPNKLV